MTCLLLISGVIDYFKRNRYTLNNRKVGVNLIAFKPDICFISLDVKYNIQLVLPFCRIRQSILRNKNSIYVKLSPNKRADIGSVRKSNMITDIYGANDKSDFIRQFQFCHDFQILRL